MLTIQYARAFPRWRVNSATPGLTATDFAPAARAGGSVSDNAEVLVRMALVDPESPFPDLGSAVDDIQRSVEATVELFTRPRVRQMLLAVLTELPEDPELRDAYRERYLRPRRRQGEIALRRGVERGELRADLDAEVLFDEIYGAIYLRVIIGADLDAPFVNGLISHAFGGALSGGHHPRGWWPPPQGD